MPRGRGGGDEGGERCFMPSPHFSASKTVMDDPMELTDAEFNRLSSFLQDKLGIKLPEAKRTMLSGRLSKRLRLLGMDSFSAYCDFVFSPKGQESELIPMMDTVTTNKTDFFREPGHFDYLTRVVLPKFLSRGRRLCRVWSAGCSTGEEPYTLVMVLNEFQRSQIPGSFNFEIIATDISTRVLDQAKRAVYSEDKVVPVPPEYQKRYLMRGKGENRGMVRVSPEYRGKVRFGRLNFMHQDFRIPNTQQVIFCRNVLIYFDKPTQEAVINRLCQYLEPGGYLFLGHSESIMGYNVPLEQEAPTVHRRVA